MSLTQLVSPLEIDGMSSGALQLSSTKNPAILSLIGNTPWWNALASTPDLADFSLN